MNRNPSTAGSKRPRSRQSIAHMPTSEQFDKENMTADVSSMQRKKSATVAEKKKSRSKSLGPGGLDALNEESGNSRKMSSTVPIKSILKPTIPLTPPKAIPTFEGSRKRSPGRAKSKSPRQNPVEDLLIDFSTPAPVHSTTTVMGTDNLSNPFSPITRSKSPKDNKVAVRTEEEQQAAAREREEKEKRDAERQTILDQREARRKSMGRRRVSFAPEATLHTWNVVEIAEDSTTSSASTNSTRRQSSMTNSTLAQSPLVNVHSSPAAESDPSEPPSTPPEQVEEPAIKASPAHQRDLHQKKLRRRSSGVPPMNFNNPDDETEALSSSPYSGSSIAEGEETPIALVDDAGMSSSSDDSDADGDTAMSLDNTTGQSVGSSSSNSSSNRLDEALRQAAEEAGTRGIEYDENGEDLSMEMATGIVTTAFQPWMNKGNLPGRDLSSMKDQENVNPFSPAFKASISSHGHSPAEQDDEEQEMSMEVTKALGGILPKSSPGKNRRKSVAHSRRRSSVARRRSSADESTLEDETMEFTTVGGGILPAPTSMPETRENESAADEDEEMTMEFTNVIRGINGAKSSSLSRRELIPQDESIDNRVNNSGQSGTVDESVSMDETMDMTSAFGGILAPIEEQTEPQTQHSVGMDITGAMGGILSSQLNTEDKTRAKELMEQETDAADGQLHSSPLQERDASSTTPKSAVPSHIAAVASETGSPSLAFKARPSGRRSVGSGKSTTPKSASRQATPVKKPSTPSKQASPMPARPTTPGKTPPMHNVTFRSASPKKLFKAEIKARSSPASHKKLFSHDATTGEVTPRVVLKPHDHLRRRSSGVGADKQGLGSPRVAALLDRRGSIGEDAPPFVPQAQSGVRFENPKTMEEEVDAEREEEERRESGRFILEQEADQPSHQDEDNATLTLKEMIQSLTPKKNKVKGRKSLHVGAAKGILGKRPAELDLEDDEEEGTPKRLRATGQNSPVKSVKLPAPPTQEETTGRITRGQRKSLAEIHQNAATPTTRVSPIKAAAETPKGQGRFKDANTVADENETRPTSFEDKLDNVIDAVDAHVEEEQADDERVHLQDFLNMTNIHFMELSTTKRRHTIAPSSDRKVTSRSTAAEPPALEDCVAAGVCTVPMLELYQHSCRELKKYISEGRRIIRSIEAETFEEQPALFKEYLSAPPDLRVLMDNQFRNVKTHARLLSKGMWYEWRMKLLEGLQEGLASHVSDMNQDDEALDQQEEMLQNIVPALVDKRAQLEAESKQLEQQALEDESEDKEALAEARERLLSIKSEIARKRDLLLQLETGFQEKEDTIAAGAELKAEFEIQIQEAERIREQCRGWSVADVRTLQSRVERIEKASGWRIVTASEEDGTSDDDLGPSMIMKYDGEIRLFFYPASFAPVVQQAEDQDAPSNAPISLTFSPPTDTEATLGTELSTEKRFILQLLQSQLHSLVQSQTPIRDLLASIAHGWDTATALAREIRLLSHAGVTGVAILSDDTVCARTMLLLPSPGTSKSRFDILFTVIAMVVDGKVVAEVHVGVERAYGEPEIEGRRAKMVREALRKEANAKRLGEGGWVAAVRGFEEWATGLVQGSVLKERTPRKK